MKPVGRNRKNKRKFRYGRLALIMVPVTGIVLTICFLACMLLGSSLDSKNSAKMASVQNSESTTLSSENSKTAYLTFDDGCSYHTEEILDILDQYGAKATFFVMNTPYNDKIREIASRGHTVALHTYSHDYQSIYDSEEAYMEDLNKISDLVYEQTGSRPDCVRFPGGSSNAISSFNQGIMTRLTKLLPEAGYQYFDWNVDSTDASGNGVPVEKLVSNATDGIGMQNPVILCHDTNEKTTTVDALPAILEAYKSSGYTFKGLTKDSFAAHHSVSN